MPNGPRVSKLRADKNVRAPLRAPAAWRWDKSAKQPQRRRTYELIERKRATDGPVEPGEAWVAQNVGSKGWHTRGYLPHCDKPGTMQMLTFRLGDAMPAVRRHEWEALRRIEDQRQRQTKLEAYLDLGYGECHLRNPKCAAAVEEALLKFDSERYRLAAWVIMPNHAHVLVELWTMPLGKLCQAWKGASANAINRILGRTGALWQEDYWDRYIRDEEHFRKAWRYIEANPVRAGLVKAAADWPHGSAHPRWQWVGASRYCGGHLAGSRWEREKCVAPLWAAMPVEHEAI